MKVQPENRRKIIALQTLGVYPDGEGTGGIVYHLIADNVVLSALLEIIVHQGAGKRRV